MATQLLIVGSRAPFRTSVCSDERWRLGEAKLGGDYTVADWRAACVALKPEAFSERWERAVAAIEARFEARFIDPANVIRKLDFSSGGAFVEGRGFAILALDCLPIESLFGYRRGSRTEFGETAGAFEHFLTTEPGFEAFKERGRAASFSRAVRNAILHDVETREGWIVKLGWEGGPLVSGPTEREDRRTVLYRNAFHALVKRCFDEYFTSLRADTADGRARRESFWNRVKHLCDESDPAFVPTRTSRSRSRT